MSASRPHRPTTTTIPIQTTKKPPVARALSSPKPAPLTTLKSSSNSSPPPRASFLYSSSPTLSLSPRQHSFHDRSSASALPARSTTTTSNYSNAYNSGVNSNLHRPVSSTSAYPNAHLNTATNGYRSSLNLRQPSEFSRINSNVTKPLDLTREYYLPSKINTIRTVKYVPSSYNRYYIP